MKKIDIKLLQDALASNGGGINPNWYSQASKDRLFKSGLIQWKPNHSSHKTNYSMLITLTEKAKAEIDSWLPN